MEPVFSDRCRACAQHISEKMISLFENDIFKLFLTCTSLEISSNDCFPTHLCVECFENLIYFNKFREKCATSDSIFRQEIEAGLELVKIEPLEESGFRYEPELANDSGDREFESEFYETEYIDEAFSQYDPDRMELTSFTDITSDKVSDSYDGKEFICDYCGQHFKKKSHVASHILQHNHEVVPKIQSSDYRCTIDGCHKVFTKRELLTSHRTNVHQIKSGPRSAKTVGERKMKLFCQKCPKWFTIQLKLDAHIRKEHEGLKPYKCTHCSKEFCKNRSYVHHMRVRHSDIKIEKFPCTYSGCDRKYELQDSLKVHINRFHLGKLPPPRNQKLICDQCGRSFKNGFNLKEHSYSHSGLLPFCCTICPKKFISNYKLKIHTMRHLNIKNFVCPTCGLRKTTNKELQAHLNFHSKEITYTCKECSRVFASYSAINRHVRIHHRNHKPYICPHCQRAFAKAETMRNHVMTHTGEKPFACTECGHRFIQSVALKAHMKVHTKKQS